MLFDTLRARSHDAVSWTRLGPYEIVSKLGSGGMGDVWKARDRRAQSSTYLADLVAVPGDPVADITQIHYVSFVRKGGRIVRND